MPWVSYEVNLRPGRTGSLFYVSAAVIVSASLNSVSRGEELIQARLPEAFFFISGNEDAVLLMLDDMGSSVMSSREMYDLCVLNSHHFRVRSEQVLLYFEHVLHIVSYKVFMLWYYTVYFYCSVFILWYLYCIFLLQCCLYQSKLLRRR